MLVNLKKEGFVALKKKKNALRRMARLNEGFLQRSAVAAVVVVVVVIVVAVVVVVASQVAV